MNNYQDGVPDQPPQRISLYAGYTDIEKSEEFIQLVNNSMDVIRSIISEKDKILPVGTWVLYKSKDPYSGAEMTVQAPVYCYKYEYEPHVAILETGQSLALDMSKIADIIGSPVLLGDTKPKPNSLERANELGKELAECFRELAESKDDLYPVGTGLRHIINNDDDEPIEVVSIIVAHNPFPVVANSEYGMFQPLPVDIVGIEWYPRFKDGQVVEVRPYSTDDRR